MINWFLLFSILVVIGMLAVTSFLIQPITRYIGLVGKVIESSNELIIKLAPKIPEVLGKSTTALMAGIIPAAKIVDSSVGVVEGVVTKLGTLVQKVVLPLGDAFASTVKLAGDEIVTVGNGLIKIIPVLTATTLQVFNAAGVLVSTLGDVTVKVAGDIGHVAGTITGQVDHRLEDVGTMIGKVVGTISGTVGVAVDAVANVANQATNIPALASNLKDQAAIIIADVNSFSNAAAQYIPSIATKISSIPDKVASIATKIISPFQQAVGFFKDIPGNIKDAVKKVVDDIIGPIKNILLKICEPIPGVSCDVFR